jgi:hypothetical protein
MRLNKDKTAVTVNPLADTGRHPARGVVVSPGQPQRRGMGDRSVSGERGQAQRHPLRPEPRQRSGIHRPSGRPGGARQRRDGSPRRCSASELHLIDLIHSAVFGGLRYEDGRRRLLRCSDAGGPNNSYQPFTAATRLNKSSSWAKSLRRSTRARIRASGGPKASSPRRRRNFLASVMAP